MVGGANSLILKESTSTNAKESPMSTVSLFSTVVVAMLLSTMIGMVIPLGPL